MKRFFGIAAVLLLVAAVTVPVVPCRLPDDLWPEQDFEAVKTEVGKIEHGLAGAFYHADFYHMEKVRNEPITTYQLLGSYGTIKKFHPLLATWEVGRASFGTWAFGIPALPDMPHVEMDRVKKTARLTPKEFAAFISWARTAKIDPATMTYTSH